MQSLEVELKETRVESLVIKRENYTLNNDFKVNKTKLEGMLNEKIKMSKVIDDVENLKKLKGR